VSQPSPRRRVIIAAALSTAAALPLACSTTIGGGGSAGSPAREGIAHNIIFIQGDGMGAAHRELLRLTLAGESGRLAMDRLPVSGSVATSSADDDVTDSAAAATAFATGQKTTNGAIGVDEDGEPLPTVLELARDAGKATGLVTTAQVTDASPAAFAAHVGDRANQSDIAEQYLERTRVDVVLGGGEDHWLPDGDPGAHPDRPAEDPEEGSSGSHGDLVAMATELGYEHVTDAEGLQDASSERLLGLFANQEMFQQADDGEGIYAPTVALADMASKALDVLDDDEDGFFLVIEEEGIDEMAHHNNASLVIEAGRSLEATIEVALAFQAEHPDTLVLVTGDHETGGMSVEDAEGDGSDGDGPFPVAGGGREVVVHWTTEDHTDDDTPVTAGGPGAGALDGEIDNTDVHTAMVEAMGLAG
jgi:alkaline phosphatase